MSGKLIDLEWHSACKEAFPDTIKLVKHENKVRAWSF